MAEGGYDPDGIDFEGSGDDINQPITQSDIEELLPREEKPTKSWRNKFRDFFNKRGVSINKDTADDLFIKKGESKTDWTGRVYEQLELEDLSTKKKKERKQRERKITTAARRIHKLYPEWNSKKSSFLFSIDEYDQVEIKLKAKGGKIYHLSGGQWSDSLPNSISNNLGRTVDQIREFNAVKVELAGLYPNNKITLENGFDLRYNLDKIEITHDDSELWYSLFNKSGSLHGNLPSIIKQNIGESARNLLDKNNERIVDLDKELTTLYPEVDAINTKMNKTAASISSNNSEINDLDSQNEMYNGSEDQTDENKRQIKTNKRRRDQLLSENNEMIDSVEELKSQKAKRQAEIRELQSQKDELVNEREVIEEKLPLRERVKQIIKRHGLTVTGVAVGTIIGVIISNLKSGLSTLAKGVGSGLKSLGAKLAAILPGMVGSIASFIFKTAGEVVGFVSKHAWLLIVGVVVYIVERIKKKI